MKQHSGPSGTGPSVLAAILFSALICALSAPFGAFLLDSGIVRSGPDAHPVLASLHLFVAQDRWVGPFTALLILGAWLEAGAWRGPGRQWGLGVGALAVFTVLATIAMRSVAHHDYDLSLDEFMPSFQAEIFRAGHFFARVPDDLWALRSELQPFFTYVDETHRLWGSGYRPVHAALLAILPAGHATAVVHGLLAGVTVLAMGSIARRLFPHLEGAAFLGALLLVSTPQFIVTATSGFAFTAHLAFNLVWLALFLRGRWSAHWLAAGVGFLAVGLHQVHVHLLFVLPFGVAMLLGAFGDRRMALPYILAYAVALPLWMAWPEIAVWLQTGDASALPRSVLEIEYIADYLRNSGGIYDVPEKVAAILLMGDLARFALWLSPALLPLVVLALTKLRWLGLVPLLCAAGIVLMVGVVHLLMPLQMHGWGARYYHPVLGNVVIVALAALAALPKGAIRGRVTQMSALLCFAGLVVLLPLRLVQVSEKVGPRARVQAAIEALDGDAVVVRGGFWFPADFVRNDPFLTNRPLILFGRVPEGMAPGRVVTLDAADIRVLGRPSGTYLEP